jgi:putative endonuclease
MTARTRKDRRSAFFRGHVAEHWAAFYLICKGYRIVTMRYRSKAGEIDIIARKGELAIFVEVKARASLESALDAVTANAKRRIQHASEIWLSRQKDAEKLSLRYDVVAIRPWRLPRHFINFF